MSLFEPGLMQAADNNGNPLAGAKWWFYLTGTSTGTAVYSDSTLATSLGTSVTSDSAGWFVPIYVDDAITYRAVLKTAAGATIGNYDIDPLNSGSGSTSAFATPEDFGAVGDNVTDDGVALNAWLAYIAANKVPFARIAGKYMTTIPISCDFNYGPASAGDSAYTTTIYCDAHIRGQGTFDHLLEIKKAPYMKWVGHLHLLGRPEDGGIGGFAARTINTGLYYESCGHIDFDFVHCSGFVCYGVHTGPSGTNDNLSIFGHIVGSRVGSGPLYGTSVQGQMTTFSARADTGSSGSFDQRSVLTVAALPPVYMDGSQRCVEVRIGGAGINYIVLSTDRGAGTISVYPWIEGGVVTGSIEYFYGAMFCPRGADGNLINVGAISAQGCGGALDFQGFYGGTIGTIHCELGGIGLRIGRDPSSTVGGLSVGRLYCEGTTKDIRLNSGSAAGCVIDSAIPIDYTKIESGAAARDGSFVLQSDVMAGLEFGAPYGGAFFLQRNPGTSIELNFNKPVADRQFIGSTLNLTVTAPDAGLKRLFMMDGGLFTCRDTTGGCAAVNLYPSSGAYTINGAGSATFGPFNEPMTFSSYINGTDWQIMPMGIPHGLPGVTTVGDAAATLTAYASKMTQRWNTALTADRAVTLSTTGAKDGNRFVITRPAAGAFNLNVGSGPLKALAAGTWCEVEYNGAAWVLTAYGAL